MAMISDLCGLRALFGSGVGHRHIKCRSQHIYQNHVHPAIAGAAALGLSLLVLKIGELPQRVAEFAVAGWQRGSGFHTHADGQHNGHIGVKEDDCDVARLTAGE